MHGPFYCKRSFVLSLTRVRAACKRERKELKKSKTASYKRSEKESGAKSATTQCSDYATQKFRVRFLVFGKRCSMFASDGRNVAEEERGSEEGIIKKEAYELGADNAFQCRGLSGR